MEQRDSYRDSEYEADKIVHRDMSVMYVVYFVYLFVRYCYGVIVNVVVEEEVENGIGVAYIHHSTCCIHRVYYYIQVGSQLVPQIK